MMRFCINAFVMHSPMMRFCIHAFVMPRPVMRFCINAFVMSRPVMRFLSCPDQWWGFDMCRPVTVWRSVALSCTMARCGRAWEVRWCCRCVAPVPAPSGPPRPLCVPLSLTPPWSAMTWRYRYDVWWFSIARLVSGVCVWMCVHAFVCRFTWERTFSNMRRVVKCAFTYDRVCFDVCVCVHVCVGLCLCMHVCVCVHVVRFEFGQYVLVKNV